MWLVEIFDFDFIDIVDISSVWIEFVEDVSIVSREEPQDRIWLELHPSCQILFLKIICPDGQLPIFQSQFNESLFKLFLLEKLVDLDSFGTRD